MIAKTKSFKSNNVTPATLQTASKLIARGARRDQIVEKLYRTRSVETLRLWGRALARLKADEEAKMVWTLLSQQDFMQAGAHEEDLPDVVDELIASSPHARVVVLIYQEANHNIRVIVKTQRPLDAISLTQGYNAAGTREEVRLSVKNKTIVQVEESIIQALKNRLS